MHEVHLDASLEAVYGRLAGRHRINASEVRQDERLIRNQEVDGSSPSRSSTFDESE